MHIDKRIIDDVQLSTAGGYEYIDDDTIELTVVFPNFQPDKSVKSETLVASSNLSKENRDKLSLQSEKPFVSGKTEVTLYEWKTAERGLSDLLDTLQRDPSIGSNVYLVVVDGSPKELLKKQYGNPDNGIFLSNLIEQNIETGLIHKTNLHQFLYKLYADGIDPVLPVVKQEKGVVKLTAIGLFKDDKLVDKIGEEDFYLFKILLTRKGYKDSYAIKLNDDDDLLIYNIFSKRKFDIPKPMSNSDITINVDIESNIVEYQGESLTDQKIKELEEAVEVMIEERSEKMIQQFQKKGTDPLGIGEEVRTRTRNWDLEKWKDLYPSLKIRVHVKLKLLETGVVD